MYISHWWAVAFVARRKQEVVGHDAVGDDGHERGQHATPVPVISDAAAVIDMAEEVDQYLVGGSEGLTLCR